MKQLSDINAQQLLRMLGDALQKEAVGWQPHMYNAEASKVMNMSLAGNALNSKVNTHKQTTFQIF